MKKPPKGVILKSPEEIMLMRESCRLASDVLTMIEQHVKPGVTTDQLDRLCHDYIVSHNATPSPLNYRGFPKSICTSINEVICHGIPGNRVLKEGDIVNVDITVYKNGFHGDTSKTYGVGAISEERRKLVDTTLECLKAGIKAVRPGGTLGDIGHAIQSLAESRGYSVVRDFCGHGIGRNFHEDPSVLHFGKPGKGDPIVPGMVFTIEPMINVGTHQHRMLNDGWTAVTADGKDSAQFEHTLAVGPFGVEVLTAWKEKVTR
ncbi:MAG: type I methionyl aminopeptidase [Planctomycetota bacterium]